MTKAAQSCVNSVDVVFLIAYSESARDHVCVVQELQRRGLSCEVGLLWPDPVTEAVIAEAGLIPFLWTDGYGRYLHGRSRKNGGTDGVARTPGLIKRAARAAFSVLGVLEGAQEMRSLFGMRRYARHLFQPGRCRALVLECDSESSSLYCAKAAREVGIPSVVLQSHLIPDEGSMFLARRNAPWPNWRPTGKPRLERLVGAAVAATWPHYVRVVDGARVLPRSPYRILGTAAFAGLPDSMWFQFGGPANWYAVNGLQIVEVLAKEGIPEKKLVPCGQPRVDGLIRSLRDEKSARRIRATLGLPVGARVAVVATQPWELTGVLTTVQKVAEVRVVCEQLVASGEDVIVLVKPHPKETVEEYEPARVNNRVMVLPPESDIMVAVQVCDVFLTQHSTTAFFAAAAGKPLLTYNLHNIPLMDHFSSIGLSLPIRRPEDVRKLMNQLMEERGVPFLTSERRRILERYIRLDGAATAAVADLIERAIREGA